MIQTSEINNNNNNNNFNSLNLNSEEFCFEEELESEHDKEIQRLRSEYELKILRYENEHLRMAAELLKSRKVILMLEETVQQLQRQNYELNRLLHIRRTLGTSGNSIDEYEVRQRGLPANSSSKLTRRPLNFDLVASSSIEPYNYSRRCGRDAISQQERQQHDSEHGNDDADSEVSFFDDISFDKENLSQLSTTSVPTAATVSANAAAAATAPAKNKHKRPRHDEPSPDEEIESGPAAAIIQEEQKQEQQQQQQQQQQQHSSAVPSMENCSSDAHDTSHDISQTDCGASDLIERVLNETANEVLEDIAVDDNFFMQDNPLRRYITEEDKLAYMNQAEEPPYVKYIQEDVPKKLAEIFKDTDCGICMLEMRRRKDNHGGDACGSDGGNDGEDDDEPLHKLRCHHEFHLECISRLLTSRAIENKCVKCCKDISLQEQREVNQRMKELRKKQREKKRLEKQKQQEQKRQQQQTKKGTTTCSNDNDKNNTNSNTNNDNDNDNKKHQEEEEQDPPCQASSRHNVDDAATTTTTTEKEDEEEVTIARARWYNTHDPIDNNQFNFVNIGEYNNNNNNSNNDASLPAPQPGQKQQRCHHATFPPQQMGFPFPPPPPPRMITHHSQLQDYLAQVQFPLGHLEKLQQQQQQQKRQ